MIFNSFNFYLSSLIVCFLAYATDIGLGKLSVLFGFVKDPNNLGKHDILVKSKNEYGEHFENLNLKDIVDDNHSYQKVDIK